MRKFIARAKAILAAPTLRPVEVWIVRAVVVYVAAKLGVSADHLVK